MQAETLSVRGECLRVSNGVKEEYYVFKSGREIPETALPDQLKDGLSTRNWSYGIKRP